MSILSQLFFIYNILMRGVIYMFKIKRESAEYESKSLRLPVEMIEQVQRLADENNILFNKVIIQCVEYALEHLDETEAAEES